MRPSATARRDLEADGYRHDLVGMLQTAIVRRSRLRLAYTDHRDRRTERDVDPWGLADKDGVWYLLAGNAYLHEILGIQEDMSFRASHAPVHRVRYHCGRLVLESVNEDAFLRQAGVLTR